MNRHLLIACATVGALALPAVSHAADPAPVKSAPRPSTAQQAASDKAKGLALAKETTQRISEA